MACPLCGCVSYRQSVFSCIYQEIEFKYVECLRCESLYCSPMPEPEILQTMYGPQYETAFSEGVNASVADPKEPDKCIKWLRKQGIGTFLDYGCGAGALLEEAARAGWGPIGVELDDAVARRVAERDRKSTRLNSSH